MFVSKVITPAVVQALIGLLVGIVGAFASGISLVVAFKALRKPLDQTNELRRAFATLEQDFEDLQRRVHGELGRISRLKRDGVTIPPTQPNAEPASKGTQSIPAPRLSRSQLLAHAHQKGAFTYGEEQNSTRIDGGRRFERPVDE